MATAQQFKLDNGLTVLLREVHSAPVISTWLAYRIGSRDERTGQTGISHWVEHMMFKGTPRYPAGALDRLIDRVGGQWNAFTATDFTMYFETLPAEEIELALDAESDRMANAIFDPDEAEAERSVIISERQGAENSPLFWLKEELRAVAFRVHGYHHDIIGDMADLHQMTRDDLYRHYQAYYVPSNAVLVAVGAFDTDTMLKQIDSYYGTIPGGNAAPPFCREEPQQQGERRVTVRRPGATAFLMMAHRVPDANHPDWFKLDMLNSILAGAGGPDNKTSRLYQSLVKGEVAVNVGGGLNESIDPYLHSLVVTLRDGRTPKEAETSILEEIDRIKREGVTEKELERAKKQERAAFAYETESVTDQGYWLAQSAVLGDPDWFANYIPNVNAVTPADIQDVARRYLTESGRNVGWLLPEDEEHDA